jgi:type IV secretion system protein TrbL
MKRQQAMTQGANAAAHALRAGDSHGAGSNPDIREKD